jgi:hypothetical protein
MSRVLSVAILLASCAACLCGQKVRFGPGPPVAKAGVEFSIKMHVSAIHIRSHCSEFKGPTSCRDVVYAESEFEGKKIELMGDRVWLPTFFVFPVIPGDYEARMTREAPEAAEAPLGREYDLVLTGGTVWHCEVTGMSE